MINFRSILIIAVISFIYTTQQIIINPSVNTLYSVSVTTSAGCFGTMSVNVIVTNCLKNNKMNTPKIIFSKRLCMLQGTFP
jgi:hypothetical protein